MIVITDSTVGRSLVFYGLTTIKPGHCALAEMIADQVRPTRNQCNVVVHLSPDNGQSGLTLEAMQNIRLAKNPVSNAVELLRKKGANAKLSDIVANAIPSELIVHYRDLHFPKYDFVGYINTFFSKTSEEGIMVRLGIVLMRINAQELTSMEVRLDDGIYAAMNPLEDGPLNVLPIY